jgi:tetratricopeptide (TPR) repeat protein
MARQQYAEAARTLEHGLTVVQSLPGGGSLARALQDELHRAQGAVSAQALHRVADRLRFCYGVDGFAPDEMQLLESSCRALWQARHAIMARGVIHAEPGNVRPITVDLLDVAILWADLLVRRASVADAAGARQAALQVLAEAEALYGPSLILYCERQRYAEALGLADVAAAAAVRAAELAPRTAWEHYALGRFQLRSGQLELAARAFERALELQPQDLWPHFYRGLCAYRLGHHPEALTAFHVCVALAPQSAECFYNRALVHGALGRSERALRDYDRALELNSRLTAAVLNRGILHYQEGRYPQAITDLQRALDGGADPVLVHYNLALTYLAQKDRNAAQASLHCVLQHDAAHILARELQERLERMP